MKQHRLKYRIGLLLLGGLLLIGGVWGCGKGREGGATKYTCPMHPEVISDQPGECPKCGMDLVPMEEENTLKQSSGKTRYTCPMHPEVISDQPGECPKCGMDLVPMEEEEGGPEMVGAEGLAAVQIDPRQQQLIGVRTAVVESRPLEKTIRTVGMVEVDETKESHVHTKISGWIEKLYVNTTGELVKKGQPLLAIYSPELVATQEEYLLALRSRQRLQDSPFPEIARTGNSLVEATRRRLELWDIPANEIRAIERSGQPLKSLVLYAPFTGYVIEKTALEGMEVKPGTHLYHLADLSSVWVEADIYESEIALVQVGQKARITVNALPNWEFWGRAAFIYPYLEGQTRTVKVRFEVANRNYQLKPKMYANVEIHIPLGEQLAVPEDAVMDTGERQYVFLSEQGHFIPRELKLGRKVDDWYEVLEGLEEGDTVVASGNFLIDSESRVKAAIQRMRGGTGEEGDNSAHAGH